MWYDSSLFFEFSYFSLKNERSLFRGGKVSVRGHPLSTLSKPYNGNLATFSKTRTSMRFKTVSICSTPRRGAFMGYLEGYLGG